MEILELSRIRIDGGTQSRAEMNAEVIADYAEALKAGAKFPPITVFYDGSDYWLADGFHRHAGHLMTSAAAIECDVKQGTLRDAVLYSVGANATNGLRRTNADKRRAVERLLADEEWSQWSNREIAKRCGVDEKIVRSLRSDRSDEVKTVTKHGTVTTMKTENIGKPKSTPSNIVSLPTVEGERERLRAAVPVLSVEQYLVAALVALGAAFVEHPEVDALGWYSALREHHANHSPGMAEDDETILNTSVPMLTEIAKLWSSRNKEI